VQQHVRDHIEDFVAIRTSMVDGKVVIHSKYGSPRLLHKDSTELYVDPVTGILCRNKTRVTRNQERKLWKAKKAADEASRIHVAKDGVEYRKVDGIWYEVIWDTITKLLEICRVENGKIVTIIIPNSRNDIFTNKMHTKIGESYRSGKRQISKKELRDLGLSNG
jgi:hypothetical protein